MSLSVSSGPSDRSQGATGFDAVRLSDGSEFYVPVKASDLVGLATSAKQDTAQTRLNLLATETTLAALLTELGQKLEPGGQVALDAATLAALESITVSGSVALDAATLAALETITVGGTVALDAATLAALENTTVAISGTVPISAAALPLPSGAAQEHATAASPHSARLSDGGAYIGSTAQRLHVDDGGSSLSVDDNAGSLTVDAPVGTPVFTRLSDGAAAIDPRQLVDGTTPTQKAAISAAGRLSVDASGVAVPVTDNGGSLTVDGPVTNTELRASAVPVSMAAQTPDVTDRAARELGRARLWDGTDEATVIPRDTAIASTDKGLAVVPLIPRRPTYQVVSGEITSATATGVKENLTLWHPSTLLKDVLILEIGVNGRVMQTAGTFAWELQFITAENATPGGTPVTPQPFNRGDAASGLTVRQVPTGAPTAAGQVFQRASFPLPAAGTPFVTPEAFILFSANNEEDAIWLRNGQAEGLRITQNIIATLTTAPIFNVYVRFIERA